MGNESPENGKCTFYHSCLCTSLLPFLYSHLVFWVVKRPANDQSDSVGGNRSKLYYVGFKGEVKQTQMDMSRLGQIPAAGTADSAVDGVAEKKGSGYTTIH